MSAKKKAKPPKKKDARQVVSEFVQLLADDAAAHPEKLGDVGELIEGDNELLGMTPDQVRIAELEAEVARLRRALRQQQPADDDDVHALVRGLKALAKGSIVVVPTKKTLRTQRREIIRKAGKKDRKVLDRLRDHDKMP